MSTHVKNYKKYEYKLHSLKNIVNFVLALVVTVYIKQLKNFEKRYKKIF